MLLDIGLGILGALGCAALHHAALSPGLLAASVLLALLPDADFLLQWIRRKKLN